jgi:hypothetical protein
MTAPRQPLPSLLDELVAASRAEEHSPALERKIGTALGLPAATLVALTSASVKAAQQAEGTTISQPLAGGGATSASVLASVLAGAVASGLVLGATWFYRSSAPVTVTSTARGVPAVSVAPDRERRTEPVPALDSASEPAPPPEAPSLAVGHARRPPSIREQVSALERMRAAANAGAFEEAESGARRYLREYPNGVFVPEAMFVLLEGRRASGDVGGVRRLAADLTTRFPNTPQGVKARALLEMP